MKPGCRQTEVGVIPEDSEDRRRRKSPHRHLPDKALNSISPAEIQAFLDKYGLTQKVASEITGLGEKNISRWLGGRFFPISG